jgi:hypothetical protein
MKKTALTQQHENTLPRQQTAHFSIVETGCLLRHWAKTQQRCSQQITEQAKAIDDLTSQLIRQRAQTIRRETELWLLRLQLDSNLSDADEVVCRTGCISHGGHWLKAGQCKRKKRECHHAGELKAAQTFIS